MAIQIRVDARDVNRTLRRLTTKTPRAAVRAMNRTISSVQTAAVREVSTDTGLKRKDVRPSMSIARATLQNLVAVLTVTGRRIPLVAFAARQTRRGVTYRLQRGRGLVPSGFIATMRSGHRGVFKRRTRRRLPISELFGPSLPRVFVQAKITGALRALARDAFLKNLKHEVDFLLRRGA